MKEYPERKPPMSAHRRGVLNMLEYLSEVTDSDSVYDLLLKAMSKSNPDWKEQLEYTTDEQILTWLKDYANGLRNFDKSSPS